MRRILSLIFCAFALLPATGTGCVLSPGAISEVLKALPTASPAAKASLAPSGGPGSPQPSDAGATASTTLAPSATPSPSATFVPVGAKPSPALTASPAASTTQRPRLLTWVATEPATGLILGVATQTKTQPDGSTTTETTFAFKPEPPDAVVSLAAAPGSDGVVVASADLTYVYTTPERQASNQKPIQIGPRRLKFAPVTVLSAGEKGAGAPARISLLIGDSSLFAAFTSPNLTKRPTAISAELTFVDENGGGVNGKDLAPLRVTVPIRVL